MYLSRASDTTIVNFVVAGLLFLTAIPAIVIFFCSLCLVRPRGDPARKWTSWFKNSFGFFGFGIFFSCVAFTIQAVNLQINWDWRNAGRSLYGDLQLIAQEIHIVAIAVENFAAILAFVTLVRLNTGVALSYNTEAGSLAPSAKEGSWDKRLRQCAYVGAGLLTILNAVVLAIAEYLLSVTNSGFGDSYGDYSNTSLRLSECRTWLAYLVIMFILAIAVTAKSIATKVQYGKKPRVKKVSTFLVTCSIMLLLRSCYDLAAFGIDGIYFDQQAPIIDHPQIPPFKSILDMLFSIWPLFILLCILFALGSKRRTGIWSTHQPFMLAGDHDIRPAAPYGYVEFNMPERSGDARPSWRQSHTPQPVPQPVNRTQSELSEPAALHELQSPTSPQPPPSYQHPGPEPGAPNHPAELPGSESQQHLTSRDSVSSPNYNRFSFTATPPPPPHADAMGLYHQADGTAPQAAPLPYNEKSSF